ncbi:MAG: glycosyltransferase [Bdellovibrionota bacterium]
MKILHVITGLGGGGAERVLMRLADAQRRQGHDVIVLTLNSERALETEFRALGIPVEFLNVARGFWGPSLFRFKKIVEEFCPEIIQSWMYHADLFCSVLLPLISHKAPLVWNVRLSSLDPRTNKASTLAIRGLLATISRNAPKGIIYCAESALKVHEHFSYSNRNSVVIPNGLDVQVWKKSSEDKTLLKEKLGVPAEAPLVGIVGRYHIQKDIGTFVAAAAAIHAEVPAVNFVMIGKGLDDANAELRSMIFAHGLQDSIRLLGPRSGLPDIYSAMDLHMLSSADEGFPNVILESMACETPCVSTNVGDAPLMLEDAALISSVGDGAALAVHALKILRMPEQERATIGRHLREKVLERYSLETMLDRYMSFYSERIKNE